MMLSTPVERRRRLAHRVLLSLSTILCSGLAAPAFAQLAPPAPVRQTVDANGVDLFNGTFDADAPGVSMGQGAPQGLNYHLLNRGNGWTDNLTATLNQSGNTVTVGLGGASDAFTISGSNYVAAQGNGATLTLSGSVFTYTARDGTVVHFDRGKSQSLPLYANNGLATDRTSPDGSKLVYAYDHITYCSRSKPGGDGDICTQQSQVYRLSTITNSYGYQVKIAYDDDDNNSPDDAGFNLTEYMTPVGSSLTNAANSSAPSLSYSTSSSGSSITIAGSARSVTYRMSGGQIVGVTRAGSSTENLTIGYNNGRVSSVATSGGTWTYTPSDSGNTRTVTVTDPLGRATTYTFDIPTAVMTSATDALGHQSTWTPDSSGRITHAAGPDGISADYTYDTRGNLWTTVVHARPNSGTPDVTTSAVYPSACTNTATCNEPTSNTDANGNTTSYTYDPTHGGVLTATLPTVQVNGNNTQAEVITSYTGYSDFFGGTVYKPTRTSVCRSQTSCVGSSDEVATTTAYSSVSANNLLPTSVSKGAGDGSLTATTSYTYSAIGDPIAIDGPLPGSADTTQVTYDEAHRPIITWSADPGHDGLKRQSVRTTYNSDGQATVVELGTSDQYGTSWNSLQQSTTTYDNDGRPIMATVTAGGTTYRVSQTAYDQLGRVTCTTQRMNPANWTTQADACQATSAGADGPDRIAYAHYDELGRVDRATNAYGTADAATERTSYTATGKTSAVTDANGNVTSYDYDGLDRTTGIHYPNPSGGGSSSSDVTVYQYDANGNITRQYLRKTGDHQDYSYDALNRMTYLSVPGLDVSDRSVAYGYDNAGELLQAKDSTGNTVNLAYDALGDKISEGTQSDGASTFGYDLASRRTRTTWADGISVTYAFDTLGQMTAAYDTNGAELFSLGYDDLGRRTALCPDTTSGNQALCTQYGYDNLGQLSAQNLLGADATNAGFRLNAAGQINQRTGSNNVYVRPAAASASQAYAVNGLNQYTSVGGAGLGYDPHGNLTQSGSNSYGYDSFNRMGEFNGGYNAGNWFYYDGLGRLNWSNAAQTRFGYDGAQLLTEYVPNGAIQRRYVYGPGGDEPIIWYEGPGTGDKRILSTDERGSVVRVSRADGSTLAINTYDEHGAPGANNQGRFGYTGQAWLPEIGLWYYKARMYSPSLGRFLQTDPIGYGDGLNWYTYAHGDAVNGTDPTGTEEYDDQTTTGNGGGGGGDSYNSDVIVHGDPCSFNAGCTSITGSDNIRNFLDSLNQQQDLQKQQRDVVVYGKKPPKPKPAPQKPQPKIDTCTLATQQPGRIFVAFGTGSYVFGSGGSGSVGYFKNLSTGTSGHFYTTAYGAGLESGFSLQGGIYASVNDLLGVNNNLNGSYGAAGSLNFSADGNRLVALTAGLGGEAGGSITRSNTVLFSCDYNAG